MAEELGNFIQTTRKKLGMSQRELAEKMSVPISTSTVGQIEQGTILVPSMPTLKALATALGISIGSLTGKLPAGADPADTFAPSGEGGEKEMEEAEETPAADEPHEKFMGPPPASFDEMEGQDSKKEMVVLAHKMSEMVVNIALRDDIQDKGAAVFDLAREFVRRANPGDKKSATEIVDQVENFEETVDWEGHWGKEVWSTAFVNDLPDESFLFVAPGGELDSDKMTSPRRLRFFPYKDKAGKVDLPHLRNAIARIPQAKHPDLTADLKSSLQEKAKNILNGESSGPEQVQSSFTLVKQADDSYRWLAIYSNNFRDDDNPPEIISAASHRRFVKMVDDGEVPMPELWYWHTKGTRWGVADFVAYDERGFALASGTVDKGKEHIAENVAKEQEQGVSHGMPAGSIMRDETDRSILTEHISAEISPLPMEAAANKLTGFVILPEVKEMQVSQEKQDKLAQLGFDVEALDKGIEGQAEVAEETQLEAKEQEVVVEEDGEVVVEETKAEVVDGVSRDDIAGLAKEIAGVITKQNELIQGLVSEVAELKESQTKNVAEQLEQLPGASLAAVFGNALIGKNGEEPVHASTAKKEGPKETPVDEVKEGPTPVGFLNQYITGQDQKRQ